MTSLMRYLVKMQMAYQHSKLQIYNKTNLTTDGKLGKTMTHGAHIDC